MKRFLNFAAICSVIITLSGCGFHLPHEDKLGDTLPKLNVTGAYNSKFFRLVVQKLRASGVEVNAQTGSNVIDPKSAVPTLEIPGVGVSAPRITINSLADTLETAVIVSSACTLRIPNHRPILMRNSITRSKRNKSGYSLASDNEFDIIVDETVDELSSQLILRLSYLGRQSDPNEHVSTPGELVIAKDGSNEPEDLSLQSAPEGMTLIEALQYQNDIEAAKANTTTLDELNNGKQILDQRSYELPKVEVKRVHQAPEELSTDRF